MPCASVSLQYACAGACARRRDRSLGLFHIYIMLNQTGCVCVISSLRDVPDRMYNQTDFYRSAFSPSLISSMDDFASPNTMFVFELKNSGFSTSAYPPASDRFSTSTFCDRQT